MDYNTFEEAIEQGQWPLEIDALSVYRTFQKEQVTGEKQNELSIVSQFLTPCLVKGRILTADARPSQHAFCWSVTRWQGHYALIANGNQASATRRLAALFR